MIILLPAVATGQEFSKQISRQSAKAVCTVPGTVHVQYIS